MRTMAGPKNRPTVVIPTTMDWDVVREGGTETFVRALAAEARHRSLPLVLLSTGTRPSMDGSVEVRPVMDRARTELAYIRRLRTALRRGELALPPRSVVLANAEHYVWPFLTTPVPIVLYSHGAVPPTLRTTRGRAKTFLFETALERRALAVASRIAVVSRGTGDYYRGKFPAFAGKIVEIPLGIEPAALPQDRQPSPAVDAGLGPGRPRILLAGRLSPEKGLPLLLAACDELRDRSPALQLLVAGDGPMAAWLRREASTRPWVHCLGRLPRPQVFQVMLASDVLAIASSYESGPLVLLEAIGLGLPVVSTRVGRAEELITDANGVLAPADAIGYAKAIAQALLLDRDVTWRQGREALAKMDFTRTADALLGLLVAAVGAST